MYEQEKIKPYDNESGKGEQVEKMFDNIASRYDTLNHWMSFDIDKRWRKKAIMQLGEHSPKEILDIATGTGDFAIMTANMMDVGRKKVIAEGLTDVVSFAKEDCMQLTFADGSFDAVTAAFGIRNFADLEKGLSEMYRVLSPGGHLCVVELTHPTRFPMKQLFKVYSHTILPTYGRLISKDRKAYAYLTATIEAFPQGETMMEILTRVGFRSSSFTRMTFGICTMYNAEK